MSDFATYTTIRNTATLWVGGVMVPEILSAHEGETVAADISAAHLAAVSAAVAPLLDVLRYAEWHATETFDYDESWPCCPACAGVKPVDGDGRLAKRERALKDRIGHKPDCALAAALRGAGT